MAQAWGHSLQALLADVGARAEFLVWFETPMHAGVVPTGAEIAAWYESVSFVQGWQSIENAVRALPYEARVMAGVILSAAGLYLIIQSFRRVLAPTQADLIRRVANAAQTKTGQAETGAGPLANDGARDTAEPIAASPPPERRPSSRPLRPLSPQAFLTADQFSQGHAPWAVPLSHDLLRIGRHQENDIRLEDKTVHRYHALLHRSPDGDFLIRDLSGQTGNGVYVNGSRIEQTALQPGDLVELGAVRLRFQQQRPS
jgi:hypothetical protein